MHTTNLTVITDDVYDGLPYERGDSINFHYNSDLSGEVVIQHYKFDTPSSSSEPFQEIKIPAWMLLEFVGRRVGSEIISSVEQQSGRDLLKVLSSCPTV